MSRTNKPADDSQEFESDRTLWRRCRSTDTVTDEGARFLDLAAFTDGLLDQEERDRVAAILANDPAAAADVAVARAMADGRPASTTGLESIIARATSLVAEVGSEPGLVLPFRPAPVRRLWQGVAQWGSLAAALAVASWLGFTMGSGVSLQLSQPVQQSQAGVDSLLPELLDPATGFLRDLGEGQQT
jgi:anti-sigma factor RsiW